MSSDNYVSFVKRGKDGMLLTQGVTAAELRLLGIFGCKLVTDAIEELDVALLWVLFHGVDEGP